MKVWLKRASRANFSQWLRAHQSMLRRLPAKPYLDVSMDYALGVEKKKQRTLSIVL